MGSSGTWELRDGYRQVMAPENQRGIVEETTDKSQADSLKNLNYLI